MKVLPASTGLGVIVTSPIIGATVSSITLLVTVVALPALSVDTIVIVLVPSTSVIFLLNEPFAFTVTAWAEAVFNFIVTEHGLEVVSFVVPDTVQFA